MLVYKILEGTYINQDYIIHLASMEEQDTYLGEYEEERHAWTKNMCVLHAGGGVKFTHFVSLPRRCIGLKKYLCFPLFHLH